METFVIPAYPGDDDNVVPIGVQFAQEVDATHEQSLNDADSNRSVKDPPARVLPLIVVGLAVMVAATMLFLLQGKNQQISELEGQALELAIVQANLLLTQEQLQERASELKSSQTQVQELASQLVSVRSELASAVEPELYQALKVSEASLVAQLEQLENEVGRQAETILILQADVSSLESLRQQLQTDLGVARAQAHAETVRSAQARADLDIAIQMVPDRISGALQVISGSTLGTRVYPLDVTDKLVRPYQVWNDESQTFRGTGEIGFVNNLHQANIKLLDLSTIQAVLPLPTVETANQVVLNGTVTTNREQLARLGARWGEQTEYFVHNAARAETRQLACNDVSALRAEMSRMTQLMNQLGKGYKLDVRWIDTFGVMRTSVSDQQLMANAC